MSAPELEVMKVTAVLRKMSEDGSSPLSTTPAATSFEPTTVVQNISDMLEETASPEGNQCIYEASLDTYMTIILFGVIFCLSVIGNSIVIVVILKQRAMRSITNIFLLNLAIADLLLSVICMPSTLLSIVCGCWTLGAVICKLLPYLQPVSVTASAYTLAVIAVERYNAICRPLQSRAWQTRSHAYNMIFLIWFIALASNIYQLFMYETREFNPIDLPGRLTCSSDKDKPLENLLYQIYTTIVLLFVPLCLMVVLYGSVILSLRASLKIDKGAAEKSPYETEENHGDAECEVQEEAEVKRSRTLIDFPNKTLNTCIGSRLLRPSSLKEQSKNDSVKKAPKEAANGFETTALRSTHSRQAIVAKQRIIRMLIVIVVIFFCCWTPNFTWWLIVKAGDYAYYPETSPIWHSETNMVLTVLCYISSCANPITYCFLNKKFRTATLVTFGCQKAVPSSSYLPMVCLQNASGGASQAVSPNPGTEETTNNRPSINGVGAEATNRNASTGTAPRSHLFSGPGDSPPAVQN